MMDLDRIERALREGPVDEPLYVPGSFRREPRSRLGLIIASATVGAAIVIGLIIGLGFEVVRGDRVGGVPDRTVTAAELEGRWVSDPIPFDAWVSGLERRGFDRNDLGNFLLHDPFNETVRYVLVFDGSQLSMRAIYDDAPEIGLSGGDYAVGPGRAFDFVEVTDPPPAIGESCRTLAEVDLDGDRLRFDVLDLPGCGVDPAIAHTAFFDLAPYTRSDR